MFHYVLFINYLFNWFITIDIFIAEPNQDLYELRRRYPSQFLALVTNYLGFLVFTSEELDQIREILVKDAKQSQTTTLTSSTTSTTTVKTDLETNKSEVNDNNNSSNSNNTNENNSKTQYTPRNMLSRLREQKQNVSKGNEINHWYTVVNAIIRFMLRNKNYIRQSCIVL
ncbi:unnamed protein product [Schistosoma margrebowiei]|uniref:Uncharacterized protein n=1 Tax=Schistosoma margrebowiei TaxID=48269 RepID=A0AA85AIS1_9TREM|nr:unnamed protein product [Schistosoma margrebowiei]